MVLPKKDESNKVFETVMELVKSDDELVKGCTAAFGLPIGDPLVCQYILGQKVVYPDRVCIFDEILFRNKSGELSQSKALETMATTLFGMISKNSVVAETEFIDVTKDQSSNKRKADSNNRGRGYNKRGRGWGRGRGRGGY